MADNHYRCDRCGAATFTGRCTWCDTARDMTNLLASPAPATTSEGCWPSCGPGVRACAVCPDRPTSATASEGATKLTGTESYPDTPCPEHGPYCHGDTCCCADKHQAATGVTSSDGDRGLAWLVAEHRPNVVTEEIGPKPLKWRTRVKCDGDSCEFYAEGERYWVVVKQHDAHLVDVLAARTAPPEGVERVDWGVRIATDQRVWDQREGSEERARTEVVRLWSHLAAVVGPNGFYNGQRFKGAELIRRTVTTYAPVVGPWEAVGDE